MLSPREYFAGQALNAMLRSSYDCNCSGYEFKNIIAGAREYADDLLNELRKTSEQGESPATDRQQSKAGSEDSAQISARMLELADDPCRDGYVPMSPQTLREWAQKLLPC